MKGLFKTVNEAVDWSKIPWLRQGGIFRSLVIIISEVRNPLNLDKFGLSNRQT